MKKKFISALVALTLLIGTTYANTTIEPTKEIKTGFNQLFTNASDVTWQHYSNFYIATFKQGTQHLTAYFNPMGGIEAVSRNISTATLPLLLQNGLHDKMQNAWVTESAELVTKNATEYYVRLENANTKTVYNASGTEWSVYKTTNK